MLRNVKRTAGGGGTKCRHQMNARRIRIPETYFLGGVVNDMSLGQHSLKVDYVLCELHSILLK